MADLHCLNLEPGIIMRVSFLVVQKPTICSSRTIALGIVLWVTNVMYGLSSNCLSNKKPMPEGLFFPMPLVMIYMSTLGGSKSLLTSDRESNLLLRLLSQCPHQITYSPLPTTSRIMISRKSNSSNVSIFFNSYPFCHGIIVCFIE